MAATEAVVVGLEAWDLTRASEKGWGAAAQMVKAVAGQRGLEHKRHAGLIRVAYDLARETGEHELQDLFDSANVPHGNFYEDMMYHEEIERHLHRVVRFVDRVERLL